MPAHAVRSHAQQLHQLRAQLAALEGATRAAPQSISSGCAALDQLLPAQGFRAGTLVQWIAAPGSGAGTLAMIAAREACRLRKWLVVVDAAGTFFPPAAWALELRDLIVIQPQNRRDQLWAIDQALRCEAIAAVWTTIDSVPSRMFRRWQLAAEQSGSLGLLVQSDKALQEPSWADVRLLVQARPPSHPSSPPPLARSASEGAKGRHWRVTVVRCQGAEGRSVELMMNDETGNLSSVSHSHETHPLHLVSQLAHSKTAPRPTGT